MIVSKLRLYYGRMINFDRLIYLFNMVVVEIVNKRYEVFDFIEFLVQQDR